MHYATALTLAVTLTAMPAHASPFGIDMGEPLSQLGQTVDEFGGKFKVESPPTQHPTFEKYYVIATPETGVCEVEADSYSFPSMFLNDRFKQVREQIASKYGVNRDIVRDKYPPGDPGLQWDERSGAELKDGIVRIMLLQRRSTNEIMKDDAHMTIQYFYQNFNTCDEILKKMQETIAAERQKVDQDKAKKDAGAF